MENHRILIVEDDEAIAGEVSRIIESWGLTRAVSAIFAMFCANLRISTRILSSWTSPCRFLTATTGAARSEKYPPCRSFSSPARRKI